MRGWQTGSRDRHTLAGVPARPAIEGDHARSPALLDKKKAATNESARLAAPTDRAAKPVPEFVRVPRLYTNGLTFEAVADGVSEGRPRWRASDGQGSGGRLARSLPPNRGHTKGSGGCGGQQNQHAATTR